ncbi:MAG: rhomboid family intramembrane serine protease [Caldilineaceae bacterium]
MLNPFLQLSINQVSMVLLAGSLSIGIIGRWLRNRFSISRTAVVASAVVLLAIVLGFWLLPSYVGTIGLTLWVLLILPSSLVVYQLNRQIIARNESKAAPLLKLLHWLQPFDDLTHLDDFLQSQVAGRQQDLTTIEAQIARLNHPQTPMQRYLKVHLLVLTNRWNEIVELVHEAMQERAFSSSVHHLVITGTYIRALGEVGKRTEMVEAYQRFQPLLAKSQSVIDLANISLFAFCGCEQQVESVLGQRSMQTYPPKMATYWRAVTKWAKQDRAEAKAEMQQLVEVSDGRVSNLAKSRLAAWETKSTSAEEDELPAASQIQLAQIVKEYQQAQEVSIGGRNTGQRPYATYALIAINVVIYLAEEFTGGSQDLEHLYRLGALVPQAITYDGEWWRIFTANFLHLGPMHLMMNMLGLAVLGPFVEFRLRSLRFLLIYLASGLGSMLLYYWYQSWNNPDQVIVLVGASGCIMGIIGANLAILLRTWRADKSQYAKRGLLRILLIIGLQAAIDLMVPVFGFLVHLSGTLIGFLTTLLLFWRNVGQTDVHSTSSGKGTA